MKITIDKFSTPKPEDHVTSRQVLVTVTDAGGTATEVPPFEAISGTVSFEIPDGSSCAAKMYDLNDTGQSLPSPVFTFAPRLTTGVPAQPKILGYSVAQ